MLQSVIDPLVEQSSDIINTGSAVKEWDYILIFEMNLYVASNA